jgi:hypothetical protein
MNGLPYNLLIRNEVVALYGIGGTYTDEILHWEVDIIYIRKDKYGVREHVAKNDDFGRDRSRCFISKELAYKYFAELTNAINLSQGVSKSIAGVEEKVDVMPEYYLI